MFSRIILLIAVIVLSVEAGKSKSRPSSYSNTYNQQQQRPSYSQGSDDRYYSNQKPSSSSSSYQRPSSRSTSYSKPTYSNYDSQDYDRSYDDKQDDYGRQDDNGYGSNDQGNYYAGDDSYYNNGNGDKGGNQYSDNNGNGYQYGSKPGPTYYEKSGSNNKDYLDLTAKSYNNKDTDTQKSSDYGAQDKYYKGDQQQYDAGDQYQYGANKDQEAQYTDYARGAADSGNYGKAQYAYGSYANGGERDKENNLNKGYLEDYSERRYRKGGDVSDIKVKKINYLNKNDKEHEKYFNGADWGNGNEDYGKWANNWYDAAAQGSGKASSNEYGNGATYQAGSGSSVDKGQTAAYASEDNKSNEKVRSGSDLDVKSGSESGAYAEKAINAPKY